MTQRRPKAYYNYDQGRRLDDPSIATQNIPTEEVRQETDRRLLLEYQSRARLVEGRGSDRSVFLIDTNEGPFNNPADTAPTKTILSFTVPQGCVFVVDGVGWKLSDPFLQSSVIFEVEIQIDGAGIPYWQDATRATPGGTGFGFPFGSMPFLLDIEPVYVQTNSTLSVLLRRFDTAFVEYIAAAAIVRGWFEKPVGGV